MTFIEQYITKKILDEIFSQIRSQYLDKNKYKLITSHSDTVNALNNHYKYLKTWSRIISFRDMKEEKEMESLYVDLQIKLTPKKWSTKKNDKDERYLVSELINRNENLVLLGNPGAGKTTTLKYVCQSLLYDEAIRFPSIQFPILIQLRTLEFQETIFDRIKQIFGLELYMRNDRTSYRNLVDPVDKKIFQNTIFHFLDSFNILILIDGLDELSPNDVESAIDQLQLLTYNLEKSKILLTCRSGLYDSRIENTSIFEICNFDNEQIISFAQNWFLEQSIIEDFLFSLNKSPYKDTSVNPLLLTLLASLYEKYKEIPPKPKSVYKKIVRMCVEDWDEQRGIHRVSKYSKFDTDAKLEFLEHFAFVLTTNFTTRSYSEDDFLKVYKQICSSFELPQKDMHKVVREVETHNGIIVQSSYDDYEYAHKSIQEYLSAEYIIKLGYIPVKEVLDKNLSNELAIATALASKPNKYFIEVFNNVLNVSSSKRQLIEEYLYRITLEKPQFSIDVNLIVPVINVYLYRYLNPDESIPMSIYFDDFENLDPTNMREMYREDGERMIENDSLDDREDRFFNRNTLIDEPFRNRFYASETTELERNYLELFERILDVQAIEGSLLQLKKYVAKRKLTSKLVRYEFLPEFRQSGGLEYLILHKEMDII